MPRSGAVRVSSPIVPLFEYCVLTPNGPGAHALLPDGEREFEGDEAGERALLDALNTLAEDGWELVSATDVLWLRRPAGMSKPRRN